MTKASRPSCVLELGAGIWSQGTDGVNVAGCWILRPASCVKGCSH